MNIFSNPVTGDRFFAREKDLNLLNRKVEAFKKGYRQNLAILGKRQIGKSSLILHFLSTLEGTNIIPAYIDLSVLPFDGFVDQFVGMLLYYNYKDTGSGSRDDLQFLIDTASSDLPKTAKKIKAIYSSLKSGKEKSAFEELLDLPLCFSEETGKFCLIVLDNFRKLTDYNLKEAFSVLGEKVMLQKRSLYILSDYLTADSKNILSEKLSLLFGKFQVIELGSFSLQESLAFIDSRCKHHKLSTELKQFIACFADGEPFYLDVLMEYIIKKADEREMPTISEKDFCRILSESIFDRFSPLNLYFSRIIESASSADNSKEAVKILNAIIQKNKITEIIEDCKCTRKQVYKLLEKFIMQGVVVKNGPLYAIEDEIFKIWVSLKETEAAAQFKLDQGSRMDRLEDKVRRIIEGFRKEQGRPLEGKILNLISAFDNEKVAVEEKIHILPVFKHIHSEYMNQEDFFFSAHGTKLWVFSIFKQAADENDVLDFINYCKSRKHKVSRKVLIILNGITPEAKLLAMEERMWIWPSDKLNSLLNLYRKPRIAVL